MDFWAKDAELLAKLTFNPMLLGALPQGLMVPFGGNHVSSKEVFILKEREINSYVSNFYFKEKVMEAALF